MTDRLRQLLRVRHVATIAAAVLAVLVLPSDRFPPGWLLAFIAPAIALHAIRTRTRLGPTNALAVAIVIQAAGLFVAYRTIGPLDRLAGLGCTLLPPLVYLTVRADAFDSIRAIFLAFCLFLIGAILGEPAALAVLAFVVAGTAALAADTASESAEARASW